MTTHNTTTTEKPGAKSKMPPTPPTPEFFGNMMDSAFKMQRQWYTAWTQPMGFDPAPEKMWSQWKTLGDECLNETEKSFERMKDYVSSELRLFRELSDRTMKMTQKVGKDQDEPAKMMPELTREWFDTSRRCAERTVEFGTKNVKAAEALGLKVSEMMIPKPVETGH